MTVLANSIYSCKLSCMNDAKPLTMAEQLLVAALTDEPATPQQLAETAGVSPQTARIYLRRLEATGYARRVAHGWYQATDQTSS